jgi:hypothetical protein
VESLSEVNETSFEEYMNRKIKEAQDTLLEEQPELAAMLMGEK